MCTSQANLIGPDSIKLYTLQCTVWNYIGKSTCNHITFDNAHAVPDAL